MLSADVADRPIRSPPGPRLPRAWSTGWFRTAQHHDGAGRDFEVQRRSAKPGRARAVTARLRGTGRSRIQGASHGLRRPGIHSHLPGGARRAEAGRHREPDGIAVRVDQEDEVRVGDPLAARAGLGDRIPVHADSQGLRISGIPVIAVHIVAGRGEPDYVALAIAVIARLAAEEPAAPEDGMPPAHARQGRDYLDQVGVLRSSVPVDPGDLVVLAVAVVVALLGSAELVTGQ